MNHFPHPFTVSNRYAQLPASFYTRLPPSGLQRPRLLHANPDAAQLLGLDVNDLSSPAWLQVVSGQQGLPGGESLATVYSGYQFGSWAGQLGDGRAHLLGDIVGPDHTWEVQLKGAGLTPYSRMGDGRAVIRSSVREYLASEAMYGLGIPTTRALALVVGDDPVQRETLERAAIVTRLAPSFVRFGTFEHWAPQPDALRQLFDYVVQHDYPELLSVDGQPADLPTQVLGLLRQVVARSARLVAEWQTVGFCHGVMNTDNMSILGLTLDYGPYGFMDAFQIDHICNHTDVHGRYAWHVQPAVMYWNLSRFAESLLPLGISTDQAGQVLAHYEADFLSVYQRKMCAKLGLPDWQDSDAALVDDWWRLLHNQQADFTLSFRWLAQVPHDDSAFLSLFKDAAPAQAWLQRYRDRIGQQAWQRPARLAGMDAVNPLYVLRNYLAEQAIRAAEQDDPSELDRLWRVLRSPFTAQTGAEAYAQLPPDWGKALAVSCSS